jgi:outer membrane protein assembly factor BamB
VLVRIASNRIGANGKVLGLEEAQRLASNEIRRLKRRGIEATTNVRTVPRVRLYSLANDGSLECRDAETGEPVWMVRVGARRLHYGALGVNEDYVSVTNGANLIQVDAATGEVIQEVRTLGAPLLGVINSADFAMIPTIGSGVEGYPLSDTTRDPFREIVAGETLALPTKAPGSTLIAWGTARAFVYAMEMQGTPSVLFRLNTDGIVSGRIASASGDRFFFGSEAGQVYGLQATRSGRVLWSIPFGEPFYDEPIVAGDQLLIRSTYGNLFSLGIDSGIMSWARPTPNVDDLLGAFGDHIFVTSMTGSLTVIDRESGKQVASFNEVRPTRLLVNKLTDRLYLVSESGDVQCLKPVGSDLPTFNIQPDLEPKTEDEVEPKPKPGASPFDPAASDPFGAGGADPFGAGGADPFGGGAMGDPFGSGDAGGDMADPFAENPFGG